MSINAPKGTKDVLVQDSAKWHYIEGKMRATAADFGYREIRTPVFEHTELFLRGIGDTTDVVQKEMYTFKDKGDRSITLKPEGTAGVVRAFVEGRLYADAQPTKMYYLYCPVFRYERPQAGRLREHHQFGVECFGSKDPCVDAEIIALAKTLLERLGVKDLSLNINSIGCPECRPKYNKALREYFAPHIENMCSDCKERFEKNPLRLLDCKVPGCKEIAKGAPAILDCLCDECAGHMEQLKRYLEAMGIEYSVDPTIVRGLDYYTKTVFEFVSTAIGAQGTVCGGGRYDGLCDQVGGVDLPGIGFGMGMERLLIVLDSQGLLPKDEPYYKAYFVTRDENAKALAVKLCYDLRKEGVAAEVDNMERSMKAQFKYADKLGVKYCVILGEDELAGGFASVKNMRTGEQIKCGFDELKDKLGD